MTRYAIYFTPGPDHPLTEFGAAWLGRNPYTGEVTAPEGFEMLEPEDQAEITSDARHYGFHATLKAPFSLAPDTEESAFLAALKTEAATLAPFEAPPLALGDDLGGFMALLLSERSTAFEALHDRVLHAFEPYRAPLTEAELERRRRARLSERQEAYLTRYGYPYVLEDWIFHMTLTKRLSDDFLREQIKDALEAPLSYLCAEPLMVDALCLFKQETRETPFRVLARVPLSG